MTLTIEIDETTLRKVAEAADRETKPVGDWARERLAEAADEQLRTETPALAHLKRHLGAIADSTFAAPARGVEPERASWLAELATLRRRMSTSQRGLDLQEILDDLRNGR